MAIKAIIGLGNEGKDYQHTYHNVGSFGANYLRAKFSKEYPQLKFEDAVGGFMNTIGLPIAQLVKKWGYQPAEILIIHDESDLPIGEYKLSFGGGSAGHKGVQSVQGALGGLAPEAPIAGDFWRLRIGVRDPNEQVRKKAEAFVLSQWSKADQFQFEKVLLAGWEQIKREGLL